jgi:hypothetical protein
MEKVFRVRSARIKMHYWYDAVTDEGNGWLDVYAISADGSTGEHLYGTDPARANPGIIIAAGTSFASNQFGLGNRSNGGPGDSIFNISRYDNLYYSTEGPNANPLLPDFIPEPGTIALLGLGTLLLRKRR